jgi:predicted oxidoreductase
MLSPIVAGTWRMASWKWTPQECLRWIEGCADMGVTSFDLADIYGAYTAEALFGDGLALAPSRRDQLQLVSKCGIRLLHPSFPDTRVKHYDSSGAHIVRSVENSLRALRTDRLDVLLLHRPDALLDADEAAEAFERLRAAGKVLAFGVSNYTPSQFALLHARTPLVTNQIELHALRPAPIADGTLDQCQQLRLRPMAWSPLAGGALLTGTTPEAMRVRSALEQVSAARGVSVATVAYAWLLRLPSAPIPISGSRRLEALREAMAATDLTLDRQEWTNIFVAATGKDLP